MPASGSILGHAVRRVEDPRILLGQAEYFDDLKVSGCAHVAFVRSTIAHALITGIDTTEAAGMPGVLGVYAAADLGLAPHQSFFMMPATMSRPVLADERVRFVGDLIVAVLAETRAQAVDAAELVAVDFDPLPAIVDPEAALAPDAPLLFPEHGTNVAAEFHFGDEPTVFDEADLTVQATFVNQRLAPVPMEPNGVVVEPTEARDGFTAWIPTQGPFGVRDELAGALGLEKENVRVIAPAVGGGFGAKTPCYPECIVVAKLALLTGRAVKWTETRSENLLSMVHGRAQVQHVELGVKRDGTITGLRAKIIGDGGAYPGIGAFLPFLTRWMAQGVYRIPKIQVDATSATTNTTPTGAYRGAGRPEATQMLERIVDIAAAELGLDPVEMRRRNLLPPDAFPLTTVTGANYDVGNYEYALDEALRVAGYDELRAEQSRRRGLGDLKQLGIGVSVYVEVTAGGLFQEFAGVEIEPDGSVVVQVGTSAHGQGHETSFAMIAAELLGVPMEAVQVVQSDTALVPHGHGTMGSRSLQTAGSAVYLASETVLERAKLLAAHLLEASVDDIVVHDGGGLGVSGVPTSAIGWAELAQVAHDDTRRPTDMEPGLAHALDFSQGEATYPFGAHVAVVEVDTETGSVELLRHVAVDDCGRVLNPLIVAGQQHGGIAQGVAQAMFEAVRYDDDGNPLTATLLDYAVPSAAELPSFEASNTETPTPLNPLGAKGIGESGTIGSTPAVHNAVIDALAPYGVRHLDMPLTPEKVWTAIRAASISGASISGASSGVS